MHFWLKKCPLCKFSYGIDRGNQPDGEMTSTKEQSSLPGFQGCGTIVITYHFRGGFQGARHPNPGQRYSGTTRSAYLPDNRERNEILCLLKKVFEHRLIFKIGTFTLSASNQIRWNDILHKTAKYGRPQK